MVKHALIFLSFAWYGLHVGAQQTFTEYLTTDRPEQGRVRVYQAEDITALVNGAAPRAAGRAVGLSGGQKDGRDSTKHHSVTTVARNTESDDSLHPAKSVARRRHKASGYRIQIFTGGNSRNDRIAAERAGRVCRQSFPELAAYSHFLSPRWVCRVGDFASYEEAAEYARKLRKEGAFREVRIVKSTVWLP